MRHLSRRQALLLFAFALVMAALVSYANSNAYTTKEISKYLESLNIGVSDTTPSKDVVQQRIKNHVDNNNKEVIAKQKIEAQVNKLLKEKLDIELKGERDELKDFEKKLKESESQLATLNKQQKEDDQLEIGKGKLFFETTVFSSVEPQYAITEYTIRSPAVDGEREVNPDLNENIMFITLTKEFGRGRKIDDFLQMIQEIESLDNSRTTLAFLVGNDETLQDLKSISKKYMKIASDTTDKVQLKEIFNKIVIVEAQFLQKLMDIGRGNRQNDNLQKKRRKILGQMRNFLVFNTMKYEKNSLFLDSDMIKLPKDNFWKIFIDSEKDIATVRIDMMNENGTPVHPDYDLNAWAGPRKRPTEEEEKKLDTDEDFVFVPGSVEGSIHLLDVSANLEKYKLEKKPESAIELKSVGGALLMVKTIIFKQGVNFPPYYPVGTSWERTEGWDGIETEGLCFQANSIGYKCWGFPNIVGYHTT